MSRQGWRLSKLPLCEAKTSRAASIWRGIFLYDETMNPHPLWRRNRSLEILLRVGLAHEGDVAIVREPPAEIGIVRNRSPRRSAGWAGARASPPPARRL